jgi:hypothetical protein
MGVVYAEDLELGCDRHSFWVGSRLQGIGGMCDRMLVKRTRSLSGAKN